MEQGEVSPEVCLSEGKVTSEENGRPRIISGNRKMLSRELMYEDSQCDELKESCAVVGCVLATDCSPDVTSVASTLTLGLIALQHRGQEGAGISTYTPNTYSYHTHKEQGLVSNIFTEAVLQNLPGRVGIGHNRYSTAGGKDSLNLQPFMVHTRHGPLAIAHNGQLVNSSVLRSSVLDRGIGLSTFSDSELITQILSLTPPRGEKSGPDWPARIRHLMEATPTSYSLAIMFENTIYGVRDPFGNRPLCIGELLPLDESVCQISNSTPLGWILSSESCAFQSTGAKYLREVLPGEIVELSPGGVRTVDVVPRPKTATSKRQTFTPADSIISSPPPAFCIFEYVYFARPDSIFEGRRVYTVRQQSGRQLASEAPVEADVVAPIPESAVPAALGYAARSGIPFDEVLCKNRYVGRSFILPDKRLRELTVAKKFGAIGQNIKGKRIVLVDDSIVRGNTVAKIIRLLRREGAKEVHLRIASPPIRNPCFMGINIPTKEELIAHNKQADDIAEIIGADSLKYLSIAGLKHVTQAGASSEGGIGHCTGCLDSNYPASPAW